MSGVHPSTFGASPTAQTAELGEDTPNHVHYEIYWSIGATEWHGRTDWTLES